MMARRATPASRAAARERRGAITDPGPVMDAAARFLEARMRSVHETRQRLLQAGYPAPLVEEVIGRLVGIGYLDDAAFARAWIESRDRAHPRGATALRRELTLKGVTPDLIRQALAERHTRGAPAAAFAPPVTAAAAVQGTGGTGRDAAADAPDADRAAARRVLDRRSGVLLREADPRRRAGRAYALLARNGFDPDTCREAVREWAARQPSATPDDEPA